MGSLRNMFFMQTRMWIYKIFIVFLRKLWCAWEDTLRPLHFFGSLASDFWTNRRAS